MENFNYSTEVENPRLPKNELYVEFTAIPREYPYFSVVMACYFGTWLMISQVPTECNFAQ
jgi:hypothetical protein